MALIDVPRTYPLPMRTKGLIRNAVVPDWRTAHQITRRVGFALARLRKMVFCKTTGPGQAPQGQATSQTPWRWLCRTGENTDSSSTVTLRAHAAVLPHDAGTLSNPRWRFFAGGNNSDYRHYPISDTSPDFGQVAYQSVDISGLAGDTEFECGIELEDNCRVMNLTVYEVVEPSLDTAHTGVVPDSRLYGHDAEITDAQHSDICTDAPHEIWKHNGAHLFNIVPETENGFWTEATGSYVNMIDATASTTPATNTPGVNPQIQYSQPAHSDTTTAVFAVYARNAATSNGSDAVRLVDTNSTDLGSVGNFNTTGEWKQTTVQMDGSASLYKVDPQFRSDGSTTLTVEAISCYLYET